MAIGTIEGHERSGVGPGAGAGGRKGKGVPVSLVPRLGS